MSGYSMDAYGSRPSNFDDGQQLQQQQQQQLFVPSPDDANQQQQQQQPPKPPVREEVVDDDDNEEGEEEDVSRKMKREEKMKLHPTARVLGKVYNKVYETFLDAIPNDKLRNTAKQNVIAFGIAMNLSLVFVFVYFAYTTYLNSQASPYLAADIRGGNCSYVPKVVSGTFVHSFNGLWANAKGFNPAEGYISFELSNLAVDVAGWTSLVQQFKTLYLDPLAKVAINAAPHFNVLYWLHFAGTVVTPEGSVQTMRFRGDAGAFFGGGKYAFGLANSKYMLYLKPKRTFYDSNKAQLTVDFGDTDWNGKNVTKTVGLYDISSPPPATGFSKGFSANDNILDKMLIGYNPKFSAGSVSITFDFAAITAAVAYNIGIPNKNIVMLDLQSTYTFTYNGVTYKLSERTDVSQTGMTPLGCFTKMSGTETKASPYPIKSDYCFINVGTYSATNPMPGLPAFNHQGYFTTVNDFPVPQPCVCPLRQSNMSFPTSGGTYLSSYLRSPSACNLYLYFSSVFFFPNRDKFQGSKGQIPAVFSIWLYPNAITDVPALKAYCTLDANKANCTKNDNYQTSKADYPWLPPNYSFMEKFGLWSSFPKAPTFTPRQQALVDLYIQECMSLFQQWLFSYQYGPLIDLATKYDPMTLNDALWTASGFTLAPFLTPYGCIDSGDLYTIGVGKVYKPFSICNNECTVMNGQIGQGYQNSPSVNGEMLQMPFMGCNDTFNLNATSFAHMQSTPPTYLVEQYFRCIPFTSSAITSAIGIAAGWSATVAPLAAFVMATVLYFYLMFRHKMPDVGLAEKKQRTIAKRIATKIKTEVKTEVKDEMILPMKKQLSRTNSGRFSDNDSDDGSAYDESGQLRDNQNTSLALSSAPFKTIADTTVSYLSLGLCKAQAAGPRNSGHGRGRGQGEPWREDYPDTQRL